MLHNELYFADLSITIGLNLQGWAILEDFIAIPILGVRLVGNWSNPKPRRILWERIDWIIKSSKNNW